MEAIWDFFINVIVFPLLLGFFLYFPFGLIGEAYIKVNKFLMEAKDEYRHEPKYYWYTFVFTWWLFGVICWAAYSWWNYGIVWDILN